MSLNYRTHPTALCSLVIALSLLFPSLLDAQVEKRVVFAKGKSLATLRGKLPANYADYDAYIIRARKGQTLSARLITDDPNAYITVYETKQLGPDEDMISGGDEQYPKVWSGKLPIKSEYSVQVYGASVIDQRSTRSAYSIEISIR